MNKIVFIYILILFYGCKTHSEQESSEISRLKHSSIANYIDFEKPLKILNSDCLKQYLFSLDGILWDKTKMTLGFGVEFHPIKMKNKYHYDNYKEKYVLFNIKEVNKKDTNYTYEAYYISTAFNSLKPCHFDDHSTLTVDSIYGIVPNFKDFEINCIIAEPDLNDKPGLWKLFPKDSLDNH